MPAHYNFYETLNLNQHLTSSQLIEAIDARLTELHQQNVPQGDERVQELFAARAVLGIEQNRVQYDAVLSRPDAPMLTIPDLQMLASTGAFPPQYQPFAVSPSSSQDVTATPAPTELTTEATTETTEQGTEYGTEQAMTHTTSHATDQAPQIPSTGETDVTTLSGGHARHSDADDARSDQVENDSSSAAQVGDTATDSHSSQSHPDPFLGISHANERSSAPSPWTHANMASPTEQRNQSYSPSQSQPQSSSQQQPPHYAQQQSQHSQHSQQQYVQNPHQSKTASANAMSAFLATLPATVKALAALILSVIVIEIIRGTANAFIVLIESEFYYPNSFPILIPAIGALVIAATLGTNRKFGVLVNVGFALSLFIYSLTYMTVVPRDGILVILVGFLELLIAIAIAVCAVLPESRRYFASTPSASHPEDGNSSSSEER